MATSAEGLKLLLAVATVTLLSIVCNAAAAQTSSTTGGREQATEMHTSRAHKNTAHVYANHMGQQRSARSNCNGIDTPTAADTAAAAATPAENRRSYEVYGSTGGVSGGGAMGGWYGAYNGGNNGGGSSSYNYGAAKLNSITNLSGLQHISGSFGGSAGGPIAAALVQEQKPIYEQQQENDYGASGAAAHTSGQNNQYGSSGSGWSVSSNGKSYNSGSTGGGNEALKTALYNLQTAGTHNGFRPVFGAKYSTAAASTAYSAIPQYQQQQSNDKIFDGSLNMYAGSDSGSSSASGDDAEVPFSHHQGGDGGGGGESDEGDDSANYASEQHHSEGEHSPSHVINYIPYPVVKKVHVPVREPVQIPVSHAVIIPVHKPVPIHVPVTKHVAVPVQKELRVPVERVVPYPVEKPVPVPVEKRIPFEVIKYVTVKVPHPFPVKVPVFKTILHKVKKGGSW